MAITAGAAVVAVVQYMLILIVGHETGSVTHDVYSKGASAVQKLVATTELPSLTV